jgi:hypothetical protein
MTDYESKKLEEVIGKIKYIETSEAMRKIHNLVTKRLKSLSDKENSQIEWLVGQQVQMKEEFQHRKPHGLVGTIIKVNPKTLTVEFGPFQKYRISKSMVNIVS